MISASPGRAEVGAASVSPHARALVNVLLATVPLLFVAVMLVAVLHGRFAALDFRYAYWSGGHRVRIGASPYQWTPSQFHRGVAFVYPALSAVMFAPATWLSRDEGGVVFTLVSVCVAPVILLLLGVRDWRVYTVMMAWQPVCVGWLTANESLYMALGLAAVWRWRDRPLVAGFLTGAMISLKPFLWPLFFWLVATRRWKASLQSVVWGVALNLLAWWIVGFNQISAYLHAAGTDAKDAWRTGFGIPALLNFFGGTRAEGTVVLLLVSAALLVTLLYIGLVRRNEIQALTVMVALAILSSPLLWSHYLIILLIPLALLRPRLHWVWLLPIPMWIAPPDVHTQLWQVAYFWVAGGVMLWLLYTGSSRPSPSSSRLPRLAQARA